MGWWFHNCNNAALSFLTYGSAAIGCAGGNGNFSSSATTGDLVLRSNYNTKLILQSNVYSAALIIGTNNYVGVGVNPGYLFQVADTSVTQYFGGVSIISVY